MKYFLLIGCVLTSSIASASGLTGALLLEHCKSLTKPTPKKVTMEYAMTEAGHMGACMGFVSGMIDGMIVQAEVSKKQTVCMPEEGLEVGVWVDLIVRQLTLHPDLQSMLARTAMYIIIAREYPCSK